MNTKKPLNNYNPNLSRKNPHNAGLLSRPHTGGPGRGPVKIKTDISYTKKPSTPDQFAHLKKGTENKYPGYHSNMNKRPLSKSKNDAINHRPSTAPQKDKKNQNLSIKSKNSRFIGPNKRLPSPQLQSGGLGSTQKMNPRYRAPSPVIKSGLNMTGPLKPSAGFNKAKLY